VSFELSGLGIEHVVVAQSLAGYRTQGAAGSDYPK
jgi:hypothetical protein